jgi:cell division protein FtsL
MEQTGKLVQDAETRAAAAEQRARDIMAQASKARDVATAEATRLLEAARIEATQLVTSSNAEAEKIRAIATTDAERRTRSLRAEVEELQRKRDGIMAQMGQLRDIVSTFAPEARIEQAPAAEIEDDEPEPDDVVVAEIVEERAEEPATAEDANPKAKNAR